MRTIRARGTKTVRRVTLFGFMAGCRSLAEAEEAEREVSPAARRLVGLPRRLADTTARDALCEVPLDGLRAVLPRLVRAAWRRKALELGSPPFQVVALDGKVTALPTLDHPLVVQNQMPEVGLPCRLARTVTCALASAAGRPCIDAVVGGLRAPRRRGDRLRPTARRSPGRRRA